MEYSTAEREAIGLCIALEAINDIANHSILHVHRLASDQAEIRFATREHQQLFLVRLLDFVKESGSATLTGVKGSCLDVLGSACDSIAFETNGSVNQLRTAVESCQSWLAAETPVTLWLPTLDVEASITVARQDLLFITGNAAKHNLSRLTGVSRGIATILARNGFEVPVELIPLALDEIRQHLQEDYFVYYGTWLTEHLTELRWGLQEYLLPTYLAACTPGSAENPRYFLTFPEDVQNNVAREWFWRLMNHVRSGPYIERFRTPSYLKEPVLRGQD